MLDITVLMQNQTASTDAAITLQDIDKSETFPDLIDQLMLDDTDDAEDGNPFVALLTELTAVQPAKPEIIADKAESEEEMVELTAAAEQSITPELTILPTEQQEALTNNVALAWINADNYEPPQYPSGKKDTLPTNSKKDTVIEFTNSDETVDILPEIVKALPVEADLVVNDHKKQAAIEPSLTVEWNKPLANQAIITPTLMPEEMMTGMSKDSAPDVFAQTEAMPVITQSTTVLTPQSSQSTEATAPKLLNIAVPVTDPQWSDACLDRIVWMGQQGVKSALITIHPEALGPLQIRVKVEKESASLNIVSHSGLVRDLLDQAMPRLRDMMMGQGITLSEAEVRSDSDSQQSAQTSQQFTAENTDSTEPEEIQFTSIARRPQKGLVDYFA